MNVLLVKGRYKMPEDIVLKMMNKGLLKYLEEKQKSNNNFDANKYLDEIDLDDFYKKSLNLISNEYTDFYQKTMYEEVMEVRNETNEFLARQEQKWGKCFVVSDAMYIIAFEAADKYYKYVSELDETEVINKKYLYYSLREIHARALQEFLEITCLIKNGFADGAYARWRSMYELSIICDFISKNGESVAKAYYESHNTSDRYDWAKAAKCFKNKTKHITFANIQDQCEYATKDWRRQYTLANRIIHASPQGTFGRLSRYKEDDYSIIAGRSDYGMDVPAEHSAISLAIISSIFFSLFPNGDSLAALKCLNSWIDIVRKYYFEVHDEMFEEDKRLIKDDKKNE